MTRPRRGFSPARAAVVAASAAAGFWLVNIAASYALYLAPRFMEMGASETMDLLDFAARALSERPPLGIDTARIPLTAGAVGGAAVLLRAAFGRQGDDKDIELEKVHGSQRLSTVEERRVYEHARDRRDWPKPAWCERVEDDNLILTANTRVSATRIPDRFRESQVPNRHVFLMAGSGAGKTYRWVRSNVLQLLGSMVFTDPKGELFRAFTRFLEAHGYEVRVLNFRDERHMRGSCHYNPLLYCESITDINAVVEMFISNTQGESTQGDQKFFTDMERNFYVAICGMFVFWFKEEGHPEDCTLPGIIDYLEVAKAAGQAGVTGLDRIFNGDGDGDFPSFRRLVVERHRDTHPGESALLDTSLPEVAVLKAYEMFKSAAGDPETMSNVVSSCAARLQILNNPAIRELLSSDDLELDRMGTERRALFLCTKDEKGAYDFISAMVLNQLFSRNIDVADASPSGHLDVPVWCFLDELANIGKVPNLERLFATTRSRWINLVAIVQDGRQLDAVYGKQAGSIRSNSAIFEYLGSSDFEDCKRISEEMGMTTRMSTEYSKSTSRSGTQITENRRPVRVPLMAPEELYNFNEEDGLSPDMCLTHYKQGMWCLDEKPDPERHPRNAELERLGPTDYDEWGRAFRAKRERGAPPPDPADPGGEALEVDLGSESTVVVDLKG